MQKVQDLLLKLPKDDTGKATASEPADLGRRVAQGSADERRGRHQGGRSSPPDGDRPRQGDRPAGTTLASIKAAELPQTVARTMVRRVEVAIELAKKDKVEFDKKMLVKDEKAKIEQKKLAILEADKAKKDGDQGPDGRPPRPTPRGTTPRPRNSPAGPSRSTRTKSPRPSWSPRPTCSGTTRVTSATSKDKEEGFLNAMQDVDKAMIIDTDAVRNGISYPKTSAR